MKALSIRQPWAWLILNAGKDIENRVWAAQYRGPLLIHASAGSPTKWEHRFALTEELQGSLLRRGITLPSSFERGGIVGRVDLIDCIRPNGARVSSPWFEGPVGWVLANPVSLPFTPYRGRLRLFDVPDDLVRKLTRFSP